MVTGGRGQEVRNGRRLALERGSVGFVGRRDEHHYIDLSPEGASLRFLNLALPWKWWEALCAVNGRPAEEAWQARLVRLEDGASARLEHNLEGLFDHSVDASGERTAVVLRLVRAWGRAEAPETGGARWPEWLRRFEVERRDPDLLPNPIGFWYARSGRSPEHFARTCRRVLGASPTGLLNEARIDYVKRRLRDSSQTVAEIAFAAGFENLGYFYRTFRRFVGCAPGVWRNARSASATVPR